MSMRSTSIERIDNNIMCEGKKEVDGEDDINVHQVLEMSGMFSVLVPDIFLNIMSRVPLKSLSQCRWVCKSWYKLVRNSSFAKIQYEWAIKKNSPCVFFWSSKFFYLVDDQVFDHLETSAAAHKLESDKFAPACELLKIAPVGYVNGLVCVASDYKYSQSTRFYISNPITGEHIIIPKPSKYKAYGKPAFGFSPNTDEYKVIRLLQYQNEDGNYSSLEAEVYTLGSSEWREIEDVPDIITKGNGVLLNGNLHWMSYVSETPIITAFDVGEEKFSVIQLPAMLKKAFIMKLRVVEENLCVVHRIGHGKPLEIWMMNDYGVESSWVKRYNFCSNLIGWFWEGSNYLIKLKNDEFLVQFENFKDEFMGYLDPKKDTLRPIRIIRCTEGHHSNCYFQVVVQVGSLFSPKFVGKSGR